MTFDEAWASLSWQEWRMKSPKELFAELHRLTTPPAAQRQWRGLTDKEFEDIIMSAPNAIVPVMLWQLIQDKLKEKNS